LLVLALFLAQNVWARSGQDTLSVSAGASGANATTITYQGRLTDSQGDPLNGNVDLIFTLYDASTGGNAVWGPESHHGVPVSDGVFNVGLGSLTDGGIPPEIWASDGDLYLEIVVNGETLSPREPMRSAAVAEMALTVYVPQWIDLPLATGFHSPPEASWQKAQYRKIGDIVYLRGIVTIDSGNVTDNSVIASLPEGYIPSHSIAFVTEPHAYLDTKHRVDIYPSGNIYLSNTAGATPHISLDGIFFSVTP
jgi:hypothetical protein